MDRERPSDHFFPDDADLAPPLFAPLDFGAVDFEAVDFEAVDFDAEALEPVALDPLEREAVERDPLLLDRTDAPLLLPLELFAAPVRLLPPALALEPLLLVAVFVAGFLRAVPSPDTLSFSPFPAEKLTLVRAGIWIVVPVRGLRPFRGARFLAANFPNPGMESSPAVLTASAMAPLAVSKIAETARAAAARLISAFSATLWMNCALFMFRSPPTRCMGCLPLRLAPPCKCGSTKLRGTTPLSAGHPPNPVRNASATRRAPSPKVALAASAYDRAAAAKSSASGASCSPRRRYSPRRIRS